MYSIIFGGILCMCSTYIGFAIKNTLDNKKKFFNEWLEFTQYALQNIGFLQKPINEIINDFSLNQTSKKKSQFRKLLDNYYQLIEKAALSKDTINQAVKNYCQLDKSQSKSAEDFFLNLGTVDKQMQLNQLKMQLEYLNTTIAACDNKCKTIGALSYKLGFVIGLALMLLIS